MMYEGKNIHCSSTDNKLLCSFSGKLCNQRRLNGYGFCVRHILEDQTAPFKRCVYVAKSSNQMCTQAIPKNEDRRYCNNHMQVLGMLPKKERKKKDNKVVSVVSSPSPEPGLLLPNGGGALTMKPKFSLSISKDSPSRGLHPSTSVGEPDDPYVFSDTASSDIKPGGLVSIDSVLGKSLQSGTGFVRSASDISTSNAGLGISGGSMIAKYYPELAEKLEKMRAKPEPKASPKARTKSSRTMNKLQTKIAQNKINEKLRKSQELIQTDSNSSPIQVSSPEAGVIIDQSPGSSPAFSPSITNLSFSPQSSAGHYPPSSNVLGHDQSRRSPDIPPLPQVDTSLLATLATQDNMGFQTMEVECNVNPSSQILPPHTPPRLPPPPYPGSSVLSLPSPLTPSDLPSRAFSPRVSSARHHLPTTTASRSSSSSTSVSSLPFTPPLSEHQQRSSKIATPLFISPTSANPAILPFSSALSSGSIDHHRHHIAPDQVKPSSSHMSSTLDSSTSIDILSLLNINHKPLIVDTNSAAQTRLPSPNTFAAQLSLPPPPPYVPPKLTVSSSVPSSTLSNSNLNLSSIQPPAPRIKQSVISRPITTVTTASVPHTKLRKVKGILNEKEALQRLKTESAVKYYSFYAKQKISNHNFIGPYLNSSDEDSDDKESEMLPWQPEIFSASSDDQDEEEDDEFDTSVPMSMRPTKLSLMKTRLRRQWHQAQQAFQSNHTVAKGRKQSTLALIRMIRENGGCAVRTLWHITHVKKSKKGLKKMLPKKKKTCCHKSSTDGPCTNPCLPYTNHCLRHVMYNIDQQIFDYCTAKFADNTQCCMPVFDIRHELPLCPIHAAKADNYQKQMEAENKKKPRKKSKPAALTRPPRKGKKKKKGRYTRTAKPLPSAETAALDSTLSDVDVLGLDPTPQPEEEHGGESDVSTNNTTGVDVAQSASATAVITTTTTTTSSSSSSSSTLKPTTTTSSSSETMTRLHVTESAPSVKNRPASIRTQPIAQTLELEETLSPDFEKQFELPLDQASRLLEESDFQEVVNKMPFEALDLFGPGKPNEADQEESDQIPLDQVSATKARDAIEKLLCGAMSEEESMQLAMVLAQNLHTDAELAQNAVALLAESGAGEATPTGLDSRMNADGRGMGTGAAGGSGICGMDIQENIVVQGPNNVTIQSQQHLHGHQQSQQRQQSHDQLLRLSAQTMGMSSSAPNANAKLGQVAFDHPTNLQFKPHQHNHLQQQVLQNPSITSGGISFKSTGPSASSSSSSFQDNATSSLSYMDHHHHIQHLSQSGLSVVYGQLGSLTQPQLSAKQSVGHSAASALCGPSPSYSKLAKTVIRHLPTETPPTLTQQGGLRLGSGLSVASSTGTFLKGDSNPKLMAVQQELRLDRSGNDLIQSPSAMSLSSSSSSSSSSLSVPTMTMSTSLSSSLSLPSLAKKAKLMNPLPPPTSAMNQEIKLQQKQSQIQQLEPPSLQLKQLQHLQQSQLQHKLLSSSPKGNILRSPAAAVSPRLNLTDATRSSPTLPPMVKPNLVDAHKLSLPDMHHPLLKRTDLGPQKPKFGPKTLPNAGVSKLKLTSPKSGLQDMAHTSNKLTLPTANSVSLPVTSSSVLVRPQDTSSPLYKPIVCTTSSKSLNTVRYTLTSTNSSNSPFTNNPLQKSLLSGPLGSISRNESPSESISVTVRHPSSLEAVPTTVRHTLPDTFPAHHSLPSSPLHFLPKSSSVASPTQSSSSPSSASSSPHRLSLDSNLKQYAASSSISSSSSQSSSSEPHSALTSQLCSPRNPWVQVQTPPSHHQQHVSGLTNGLPPPPYPKTNTNHELTSSKLNSPSSQSVPPRLTADSNLQSSGKQHHSSSLLGPGPHMPVVCSGPVTLPGFALPLPATAFKTTGTS